MKWIKVWVQEWLFGSARHRSLHYQAILIALDAMSGEGRFGDGGVICLGPRQGIPDKEIAKFLMPDDSPDARKRNKIWQKVKPELIEEGEISIDSDGIIIMLK
ncbi:unnamed protein product, partial [marine sediment metagenome]